MGARVATSGPGRSLRRPSGVTPPPPASLPSALHRQHLQSPLELPPPPSPHVCPNSTPKSCGSQPPFSLENSPISFNHSRFRLAGWGGQSVGPWHSLCSSPLAWDVGHGGEAGWQILLRVEDDDLINQHLAVLLTFTV